jgi:hypothetical protein
MCIAVLPAADGGVMVKTITGAALAALAFAAHRAGVISEWAAVKCHAPKGSNSRRSK